LTEDFGKLLKETTSKMNGFREHLKVLLFTLYPPADSGLPPPDLKIYGKHLKKVREAMKELEVVINQFKKGR